MQTPRLRFKRYTEEWKSTLLGDIASVCMCKRIFKEQTNNAGDIPFYKIGTFGSTPDSYITRKLFEEYKKKFNYPKKGEILISAAGTIGRTVEYKGEEAYYQDSNIVWLNVRENIENAFLKHYYSIIKWSGIEGSTIKRLYNNNILQSQIHYPCKEEQTYIANFLNLEDQLIQDNSNQLKTLKKIKSACLQSMFPQEGESVPKVRFKGFNKKWNTISFFQAFEFLKNNSLSRAELAETGTVYNIHYGDILIKFGDCLFIEQNSDIPFIKDEKIANKLINSSLIKNGDIIFADAAEDYTVGKCIEIITKKENKIVSGLHTIACRPTQHFASGYLGYFLNSNLFHNQLIGMIQGSKVCGISKKGLQTTQLIYPEDLGEQQKIAAYFENLDRQISLQTQRLEKLKQIKSACLDKMFV